MKTKKILSIALAAAMTLSLGVVSSTVFADEIVINYPTFQVGSNSAAPVVAELVDEFNEIYAGQYKIVVEDVPGDQNYADKIKVQITSGQLPPVCYGAGYKLLDMALGADLVVDITDAVNADPDWAAMFDENWEAVDCRDGKIYAASSESEKIGYFYNKELYEQAGIEPATTWDEFFANCEALKEAGITPIAMDTADGAWCTQLLLGAMIATSGDEGLEFMKSMYPTDYSIQPVVDAITRIQEFYTNYTTMDANGGAYENAANNFFSGNVAMICNGPWMIGDFSDTSKAPEGFADKVGVAIFPGGFVYDSPIEGMFVTKQDDPALEEAAIAMVKFFTSADAQQKALEMQGMVPAAKTVEITDAAKESFPLLADFIDQAAGASVSTATFTGGMVPGLEDLWSTELPNLASGAYTPEELCQILTDFATENAVTE
ncbi:MAG: carbohydrate ABC transporter substrate-binding protein [Blautia sp.]|nr:carbohydrate ABC transporter substrate-binding protein [Blautia sp.]